MREKSLKEKESNETERVTENHSEEEDKSEREL